MYSHQPFLPNYSLFAGELSEIKLLKNKSKEGLFSQKFENNQQIYTTNLVQIFIHAKSKKSPPQAHLKNDVIII